jgi:hypothetical protein
MKQGGKSELRDLRIPRPQNPEISESRDPKIPGLQNPLFPIRDEIIILTIPNIYMLIKQDHKLKLNNFRNEIKASKIDLI